MTPAMNHRYMMVIKWSEEDELDKVHLPEFPCKNLLLTVKLIKKRLKIRAYAALQATPQN